MTVSGNAGSEPGERRILVLGADGFIGRRVVAALAESGWARPIAAGRRAGATSDGIERRVFDATDAIELADAMRDADGVVSCIAGSATTIVDSARALFWPVPGIAPPRIVYLSSMAVYGSAVGDVAEDAPLLGDVGPYSAAKVIAEGLAADTPETVVLRPGCVYGPDSPQWSVRVARWLEDRRIGDLGSAGDGLCNLIHVDDVARAVLLALRAPRAAGQAYNLSLDQPPTWNDYFVAFAKALRAVPVQRISRRRLAIETKLFAPPLKIAEILARRLGGGARDLPPPIPPSLLGLWRQEIRLTMDKTREELDLTVRPLEEGLRETAAALRSV
jgi:nucleoside-diphosphate-sugar epimerase